VSPERFRASVKAGGGVLHRVNDDGKREFLLVHRPGYDDWSLPKGKLDRREGFLEAALREVREETGIQASRPIEIGSVGYESGAGNRKVVRWWLMDVVGGKFRPNHEVDEVVWLTRGKAMKRLHYRNDRNVLLRADALADDPTSSTIYLVRHAPWTPCFPRCTPCGDCPRTNIIMLMFSNIHCRCSNAWTIC
jgi:8-oxo-dGTP diphosphatase